MHLPRIGQFFDTMIVALIDNEWYNGASKSTSWKVLETALSHLNAFQFDCYHLRETRFSGIKVIRKAGVIEQKSKNRKKEKKEKETSDKRP